MKCIRNVYIRFYTWYHCTDQIVHKTYALNRLMFHLWCLNSCSLRVTQSNCVFSSFTIHRRAWMWLSFFFLCKCSEWHLYAIDLSRLKFLGTRWHQGDGNMQIMNMTTNVFHKIKKVNSWMIFWERKFASFDVFVFEHVPIVTAFSLPLSPSSDLLAIKQCVLPFFITIFELKRSKGGEEKG